MPLNAIEMNPESGWGGGYIPTQKTGDSRFSALFATPGRIYPVVPDDSTDEGITETLALSLVERGLFVGVAAGGVVKAAPVPIVAAFDAKTEKNVAPSPAN